MKSFVLCDKKETLLTMRFAGIDGKIVKTKEEMEEAVNALLKDEDTGLVILSENVFDKNRKYVMEKKLTEKKKLLIHVPEPEGLRDRDYIMKYIKNSIGIKL
ncbi:MAG: V-type ATP synthase subunit F [Peptostreptococcaceae bacterium]|nr:V-type ATP synthase subunit F [Peptostreptococcaceae bacterium]